MSDDGYNGWTNYATWNVALWFDNEYSWYQAKIEFLQSTEQVTEINVENFVKSLIDRTPDTRLHSVDWADLAQSWKTERKEMLEYE